MHVCGANLAPSVDEQEIVRAFRRRLWIRILGTVALLPIMLFVVPRVVVWLCFEQGYALLYGWGVALGLFFLFTWAVWRCPKCRTMLPAGRGDWWVKECPRCQAVLRP
jgi:hypothetical protein